jgi:hypothetical protein
MKIFKFEISTIIFLFMIVFTIIAWAGFEFFYRQNDVDIDPVLRVQSTSSLPDSFDEETLKLLYTSKDKFYESSQATTTPAATQ